MKTCCKCGEIKPLTEYYRGQNYKDGHSPMCKVCASAANRAYQKSRVRVKLKKWPKGIRFEDITKDDLTWGSK